MKYPPRGLYVIRGTSDGGLGQGATSSPESGNAQPPLPVRSYRESDWSAVVAAVSFVLAFVLVLTVAVASR